MPRTNVPVFCEHCGILNFGINVFGTITGGEREMLMFAEVLLDAHRQEFHRGEDIIAEFLKELK